MTESFSFPCPRCQAGLRAPVQLVGRSRKCPACGHAVAVPSYLPDEVTPLLVFDDGLSVSCFARMNEEG
jgi:hypothetical protein